MLRHLSAALAAVLTCVAAWISGHAPVWPTAFAAPAPAPSCIGRSIFDLQPFRNANTYAHASSAVLLRDGRIRAVWYEGPKELSPNVKLWTATYDGTRWSEARPILDPAATTAGTGRYVQKLANTLIFRDPEGRLVILFASLGIGGWDTTSLKMMQSPDEGETWTPPRSLTTTPTFNFATNVRGPAVAAEGGFTLIPTSHEFLQPFPEVTLLDSRDRVVGKRRIGISFRGSQPFITVLDKSRALAFMRVDDAYTLRSKTDDAGASWTEPEQTTSPNLDSPVVVTPIGNSLLMVTTFYDRKQLPWWLTFAVSTDAGRYWRTFYAKKYDWWARYPWLMVGKDGLYHLLYTLLRADNNTQLMHARISRDWIAENGGPACP